MEFIQSLTQNRLKDFVIVLGLSILLALSAWISIRLPFTPVPISFTVQLVLFFAAFFGKNGAHATALYLTQGILGLPVFANGGCGLSYLMGPTGGYLIGFLISAYVVATLVERMKHKTPASLFITLLLGNGLVYVFGLPHLALFMGSLCAALKVGFYPFIGGDLLKLILVHHTLNKRF